MAAWVGWGRSALGAWKGVPQTCLKRPCLHPHSFTTTHQLSPKPGPADRHPSALQQTSWLPCPNLSALVAGRVLKLAGHHVCKHAHEHVTAHAGSCSSSLGLGMCLELRWGAGLLGWRFAEWLGLAAWGLMQVRHSEHHSRTRTRLLLPTPNPHPHT